MQNHWKWGIGIVVVFCIVSLIVSLTVYGDIQSTANAFNTPIQYEISDIRPQSVDIKTKWDSLQHCF